jgi:hypothetical protein
MGEDASSPDLRLPSSRCSEATLSTVDSLLNQGNEAFDLGLFVLGEVPSRSQVVQSLHHPSPVVGQAEVRRVGGQ